MHLRNVHHISCGTNLKSGHPLKSEIGFENYFYEETQISSYLMSQSRSLHLILTKKLQYLYYFLEKHKGVAFKENIWV